MDQIKQILAERQSYPQPSKKLPAHHFQQVALDIIEKLQTPPEIKSRVFGAVRRNEWAAAAAFNSTMAAADVQNRTMYFLDLFNRAAGKSRKEVKKQ